MREVSFSTKESINEVYNKYTKNIKDIIDKIRKEKSEGLRPLPSKCLIDKSKVLTSTLRSDLLDRVAILVDENLSGRSDMCIQFASLLELSLHQLKLNARAVIGEAKYFNESGNIIFSWKHAWLRIDDEVIDGNVDILFENPCFPKEINIKPYWGPIKQTPSDRKLIEDKSNSIIYDEDVKKVWWPELFEWLSLKMQ